jgi:hypothetical protein
VRNESLLRSILLQFALIAVHLLLAIDGKRAQIQRASYCLPIRLDLWFVLEPSDLAAVLIQMLRLVQVAAGD